jgi:hypothetical protein
MDAPIGSLKRPSRNRHRRAKPKRRQSRRPSFLRSPKSNPK